MLQEALVPMTAQAAQGQNGQHVVTSAETQGPEYRPSASTDTRLPGEGSPCLRLEARVYPRSQSLRGAGEPCS